MTCLVTSLMSGRVPLSSSVSASVSTHQAVSLLQTRWSMIWSCTNCMACSLRRLLPVSACMLHIACGVIAINRQCAAPTHPAARTVHRTSQRGRPARATSAAMKPIVVAPQAPHTGTVIMLHGLGDTGAG
jgi:heterodisulfide reductase subunit C